jgi:ankyrin repeat protein
MVWCIEKAYKDTLDHLLRIASNQNTTNAKLIYREAAEVTEAVDGDRGEYTETRVEILRRLASIYQKEQNLPFAENMLEQVSRLNGARKASCDSEATSDLAACFRATAAETGRVLREIGLEVKPPLYFNPDIPFPSAHRALRGGYDDVTRLLCQTAASLKDRDMLKQNALVVAAALGKTELLDPAFRSETSLLSDRDVLARTALFHAAHNGELEPFLRLVGAGAGITDRDASSQSILRVAAAAGSTAIVHWLLTHGLSPNDDHFQMSSPLHEAARKGHGDVCRLLLNHGAWANCRQHTGGKTPGVIALENNFPAISNMIEDAASRPVNNFWSEESRQAREALHNYGYHPLAQGPAVQISPGAVHSSGPTTAASPIGPQASVVATTSESSQLSLSGHRSQQSHDGLFPRSTTDTTSDLSMCSDMAVPSSPFRTSPGGQDDSTPDVP